MATYRIYNIQLLPLDTSATEEVGKTGYMTLFNLLSQATVRAKEEKRLLELAYVGTLDLHFSPDWIDCTENYAFGNWAKFNKANEVSELETKQKLFEAPEGTNAVSNLIPFRFIFDFDSHRMAISEEGGKLPSTRSVMKAIDFVLRPIASDHFPNHFLTVNVVTERSALEDVLRDSAGFKRVEVSLHFPNGSGLTKQLKELKKNNIHVVKTQAVAAKGAYMPSLPGWLKSLMLNAVNWGSISLTYISKKTKRKQKFESEESPARFRLDQKKQEADNWYRDRVVEKLREQCIE